MRYTYLATRAMPTGKTKTKKHLFVQIPVKKNLKYIFIYRVLPKRSKERGGYMSVAESQTRRKQQKERESAFSSAEEKKMNGK